MDPRVRIRAKISWIRNTVSNISFKLEDLQWICSEGGGGGSGNVLLLTNYHLVFVIAHNQILAEIENQIIR